jgi:NAD+ kinase
MGRHLNIAVFPNVDKRDAAAVLRRIVSFFEKKDVTLMLPVDEAEFFHYEQYATVDIVKQPIDMALSIGGDGTLLGVCRRFGSHVVPVCGINIGTLGFMADIEVGELENRLEKILTGEYYIECRLLLAGYVCKGGTLHFLGNAINDVVVTKGGVARMLHLGLSINQTHLMDYKADGMIVASPTGSTAYSLSAGGPIMNPTIKALLVTPICAHTFNMRPLVVSENDIIHIFIAAVHQDIIVTFDGQESFHLQPGDEIIVKKAKQAAKIVKFEDKDYYQILKDKLWSDNQ